MLGLGGGEGVERLVALGLRRPTCGDHGDHGEHPEQPGDQEQESVRTVPVRQGGVRSEEVRRLRRVVEPLRRVFEFVQQRTAPVEQRVIAGRRA